MWKFLLLDSNVIGIITSFISDNFDYLHFLKENNVKPYYKEIEWKNVNWDDVSSNIQNYDVNMIEEYKENFNWTSITSQKMDDQEFLTKYSDFIDFELINSKMRFSYSIEYNFYETFKDKFDWGRLSRWADMAEDFIDMFHDKLDWSVLCRTQGLTSYLLNKYYDKLILSDLRYNYHIETNIRNEIIQRLTNDIEPPPEENNNNSENNEEVEEDDIIMNNNNNDERDVIDDSDFDISDNIPLLPPPSNENNSNENIENLI